MPRTVISRFARQALVECCGKAASEASSDTWTSYGEYWTKGQFIVPLATGNLEKAWPRFERDIGFVNQHNDKGQAIMIKKAWPILFALMFTLASSVVLAASASMLDQDSEAALQSLYSKHP